MRILRELSRRRLRTTLTILGITIGIWALVVFSSMANKINSFVASGSNYYVGKIIVSDASTGGVGVGVVPIDLAVADEIRGMPGVAAVDPQVQVPFEDGPILRASARPRSSSAVSPAPTEGSTSPASRCAQGRLLTARDEGSRVAVLGSDLARDLGATVGDSLELRGIAFEVVGILQPTLSLPRLDGHGAPGRRPGALPRHDAANAQRGARPEPAGVADHRLPSRGGGRGGARPARSMHCPPSSRR